MTTLAENLSAQMDQAKSLIANSPDKVEYQVRRSTRYIVTRYSEFSDGDLAGSEGKGEFANAQIAYEVAYALCKEEHRRLGWALDDPRIKYPEDPTPAFPDKV